MVDSKVLELFIRDNADCFGLSSTALKARLTGVHSLQRRLSRGPRAGSWVPSTSVRIQGDQALVATVLRTGTAVIDFHPVTVRPFEFAALHCFHCGSAGHAARHCRGRCHRCDRVYPTVPCPAAVSRSLPNARVFASSGANRRSPNRASYISRGSNPGTSDNAPNSGNPGTSGKSDSLGARPSGGGAQW